MQEHPVPQNIASFQFKLFGNLTVRQFFILLVPLSLALVIYFSPLPPIVRIPLAVIIGILGFVIAVVPFNGMPFDKWSVAFIRAITSPTQRIWIKEKKMPEFLTIVTTPPPVEEKIPEEVKAISKERLMAYLKSLPKDSGSSALDVREQIAIQRLDLSSGPAPLAGQLAPAIVWPTAQASPDWQTRPISLPMSAEDREIFIPQTSASSIKKAEISQALPEPIPEIIPTIQAAPKISDHAKPYTIAGIEKRLRPKTDETLELINRQVSPRTRLASETNFSVENIIPIQSFNNRIQFLHGVGSTRVRKLHFAPPENFDLSKLPIRGEKRFEISDELKRRFHFEDMGPEVVFATAAHTQAAPQIQNAAAVPTELPRQTKTIVQPVAKKVEAPVVEEKKDEDFHKFSLSNKVEQIRTQNASSASIIPLTSTPNVISGIVTDSNGSPLEAAVIVVRDPSGIPVRALKTNKLGQFLSATPLGNGSYTIETENDIAVFRTFSVNLEGKVVGPIQIQGEVRN